MTNSSNKYILMVMTAALLSACSVTKKYERPTTLKTDQLYRDQSSTDSTTIADMPWNTIFKDEKLNALIQKGLDQNLNLKNAIENIVQARASLRQSKLAYYPTLQLDASATHNKQSQAGLNFPAGININTLTTTYKLGASTSWEIDVWGKLSSSKRAALATYLASDAAKQAVQTQLIADIANNYFALLAYDKSLKITQATLESRIKNVETIKALKEGAIVTGAAVVQSEANQHAAEVLIPDLKQNIRETENALNILLGQAPGPIERGELGTQIIPEQIAIGMPAQLLNNRPDVRQAEFNFRVAFESTNLAKTYFYPSLTLTASTGFSNLELKDFFSHSIFYSIIGGLTQPIFNQGLNKMRLTTAQSQQLQAYNNFQQSLLVAGQEVSNALYSYQMAVEKEDSRTKQIEALEKAVDFTQQLLEYSSATNYTDVLTSEQNLLSAQLSGVNDNLQKLQAVINLYRALGGGWK
ncbi:NodT family efflux transporter outer membrane factor (OMF) lipoprotein [Flavobacterium nitrogenifigens]|uniref:NodT family efflux transporter outer membrane factor (OMF) lipoprotein n=2 Tax=Flavobacterium TaxID=237 RepID=A0A7W7IX68_9FLAO|nr:MULTISPECIES: efflux transporter outer membrane subunit [Flavobacterium]MBB4802256.1 NodT family efflux transporter outer membrane factor (OMF) lipoprotein [Flavobacterium nitrogenifigens]MBB6387214.1 NodT family efflux transporter outer membrane factor (OMF) lipoprotein [Flavobacterium notoginsengisoli]